MNRRALLVSTVALSATFSWMVPTASSAPRPPVPPRTPRRPQRIEQFGRVRVDDYAWLKDPDWKQVWRDPSVLKPEIRRHLDAETAYAKAVLAPTRRLEATLLDAMRGKIATADEAPPIEDGGWIYGTRKTAGGRECHYRRRGVQEEILLDGDVRAQGASFLHIANVQHSPDHRFLAWAEDREGSEKFRIFVKDLASGVIGEPVADAFGNFTFSPDSRWLFWVFRDDHSRPTRIFRRPVAGGPDTMVHDEVDPAYFLDVTRTAANTHLMIRIWNGDNAEVRLIDGATPTAMPRVVAPRRAGVLYSLERWDGRFVVLTNADGATDFKLMWADGRHPDPSTWETWVEHRPGRLIMGMHAFAGHFVRIERVDGNPVLVVTQRGSGVETPVAFDEAAYALSTEEPQDHEGAQLRFTMESPRLPRRWLALDMATGAQTVRQAGHVAGAHRVEDYVVERLFAVAADGERVPITLLRRRETRRDGTAPLLLNGYGAYGFSTEAEYAPAALALVDRGWMWAIAHVRGGSEKGRSWYLAARARRKKNSFSDFVACAEHLARERYTAEGRMVAQGFSAGGLLVGAALNLKPGLWAGVIARAPFVDMLNTMSDAAHPLVPLARPDWGDPLANPEDLDYIASYSPYENIVSAAYPAVLATTSVTDDRVGYWEPAKWIARLREKSTSGRPVLLRVDTQGGHGGASGTEAALRLAASFNAFAIWAVTRGRLPV